MVQCFPLVLSGWPGRSAPVVRTVLVAVAAAAVLRRAVATWPGFFLRSVSIPRLGDRLISLTISRNRARSATYRYCRRLPKRSDTFLEQEGGTLRDT